MPAPLLSIIVATWNRPERLNEALKSISLQDVDARFEVIVVNDGGTDVGDIVELWARVMTVQHVRLDTNAGLARARNEGIRRASGAILCFLDDDDIMLAGHLRAGVEHLSDDADAVCLHVAMCDEFVPAGSAPTTAQIKVRYAAPFDDRLLMICNFLPVNALFMRRKSGAEIAFDETLTELEDWDLWLRLRHQLGYRFKTVPLTTTVYHRVAGFGTMTSRSRESADEALRYRETFRRIISRYPAADPVVVEGRALHDRFYDVLAQTSRSGLRVHPFAYERFVDCVGMFTSGTLATDAARARIDRLVTAS